MVGLTEGRRFVGDVDGCMEGSREGLLWVYMSRREEPTEIERGCSR